MDLKKLKRKSKHYSIVFDIKWLIYTVPKSCRKFYSVFYFDRRIDDQSHPPNKRKKTSDDLSIQGVSTTSPSTLTTLKNSSVNGSTDYLRRSNRRQKVRGEKEYLVNSTMLLRDFKVKVYL